MTRRDFIDILDAAGVCQRVSIRDGALHVVPTPTKKCSACKGTGRFLGRFRRSTCSGTGKVLVFT